MRARPRLTILAAAAPLIAGCASLPREPVSSAIALPEQAPLVVVGRLPRTPRPPQVDAPAAAAHPGSEVVLRALALTGVRYRYGGNTPTTGFDCSGFVRWVYREVDGVELPRSSRAMAAMDRPAVPAGQLLPGDLVFFRIRGRHVSHVGIYTGDGRFVHAPSRGGRVRVDPLDDPYWQPRYAGARRVIEPAPAATASAR